MRDHTLAANYPEVKKSEVMNTLSVEQVGDSQKAHLPLFGVVQSKKGSCLDSQDQGGAKTSV